MTYKNKIEFKDRLKELRLFKGMTQAEVAEKFGKSESAIRMWELGKSKPDADTLIEVSKEFGCSTDYLLGLPEDVINEIVASDSDNTLVLLEDLDRVPFPAKGKLLEIFNSICSAYLSLVMSNLESSVTFLNDLEKLFASISLLCGDAYLAAEEKEQGIMKYMLSKGLINESHYLTNFDNTALMSIKNTEKIMHDLMSRVHIQGRSKLIQFLESYSEHDYELSDDERELADLLIALSEEKQNYKRTGADS